MLRWACHMSDDVSQLSLNEAAAHLLQECRMVLPGIQALFGFQLVAVFDSRFSRDLSVNEQRMHLAAILCIVLAVALVMAPAAIHRSREPNSVSRRFLQLSSRLLMASMAPLAIGTSLDVYLVARLIAQSTTVATACALVALVIFATLWVLLPRVSLVARRS
jgi:hypothetical protein